jgi:hypothetical protein
MIALALPRLARTLSRVIAGALVLFASVGLPLEAQDHQAEPARACLDTISRSTFVRVPVYLEAKAADSLAKALLPGADTLALHVAAMIRSSLSESATSLPEGETLLQWRQVGGAVRIVAHRDGRFALWTPREPGESLRAASRLLLVRAISTLSDGGRKFGWPTDIVGDSATFDLEQRWADVTPDGTLQPLLVSTAAMPMFSMAMPRSQEVVMLRPGHLNYPPDELSGRIEGVVVLAFVVDSTGRVVKSSVKDTWPADRPRLTGVAGAHYDAFVNAARMAASDARYQAARVGGCPVEQLVQQPFTFTLKH